MINLDSHYTDNLSISVTILIKISTVFIDCQEIKFIVLMSIHLFFALVFCGIQLKRSHWKHKKCDILKMSKIEEKINLSVKNVKKQKFRIAIEPTKLMEDKCDERWERNE